MSYVYEVFIRSVKLLNEAKGSGNNGAEYYLELH